MDKFSEYPQGFSSLYFLEWHTEGELRFLQWCQSYCSRLHVVITLNTMVRKMIL
jgi:hypothetical protein